MKKVSISALALLLASACAQTPGPAPSATSPTPTSVTLITPSEPASLDPKDSILFWSDERRSDGFRHMDRMFPGQLVKSDFAPRTLLQGAPLSAATQEQIRGFMDRTHAAGLMVLQDGKLRYENYGLSLTAEDSWTSFSVAKSFTSTLLGAAIADGAIASLDTPVTAIIPELKGTAYDGVTVGQVATMTSGVAWNEDYTDPNSDVARMLAIAPVAGESQVITYARTLKREAPAGSKWVYKTLETNLLGLIVEKAVGRSLAEYAADKIVRPAGFDGDLFWMVDLSGGNIGGCCLSLRLADYARFGQFVLEGGKGVVPEGWFADAGKAQVSFGPQAPGYGYGYQWWAYPGGNFGAQGIFGQAITVVPEKKLVIAAVSNWATATSKANREDFQKLVAAIAAD